MSHKRAWKTATVVLSPAILYAVALFMATRPASLNAQTTERTVMDGVYTAAQAERGKTVYLQFCSDCHNVDLSGAGPGGNGNAPSLKGARFIADYEADSLARPFNHMRGAMPQNAPGTLKDDQYIDILAHVLQVNDYPAGANPLTPDAAVLRRIRIVRKGGPVEAPNFTLVRLVGCLDGAPDNWSVTRAAAPVVTKEGAKSAGDDLQDAAARPLGTDTFKLLNTNDPLDSHKGHKMEVKGLLIRQPTGNRINVVSVQMVSESCAN